MENIIRELRCSRRRYGNGKATQLAGLLAIVCLTATVVQPVVAQSATATPAANPSLAGPSLSPTLQPSYAGMGIEPVHLFDYVGRETVNNLTFNLLDNLGSYTGTPPHLRIGGNSGDSLLFNSDPQYGGYQVYPNPSSTGQGSQMRSDQDIIGMGYFRAMDMLPKGTPITYGLNLAYNAPDYLTQIVNQASAALQLLSNVKLVSFEVGNEPDLYTTNKFRDSHYTATTFGQEWAERVKAIYENVLKPKNLPSNFFESPASATTATSSGRQYRISNLVNTGVAADNGIYVAGWNQHDYYYYVNVSGYTLTLSHLLDMSTLYSQLSEWRGQAGQAQVTGKPYFLREMGSVGPTGMQGITDVFANTLWTLNVFLYCATIQMSAVQIHMTSDSYASPWQPIPFGGQTVPYVRTTYYAFAAMAQIIGKSCTTQVSSVTVNDVPSAYANLLSMYSVYQLGTLRALVMINTKAQYTGQPGGTFSFMVQLPTQLAGQKLYLSALTAPGVDAMHNTTWNGISYEQTTTGKPTFMDNSTNTVTIGPDGKATIPVPDSQAIVAALDTAIGKEENVDRSACMPSTPTQLGVTGTASTYAGVQTSAAPTFRATAGFASSASRTSLPSASVTALVMALVLPALMSFFMMYVQFN